MALRKAPSWPCMNLLAIRSRQYHSSPRLNRPKPPQRGLFSLADADHKPRLSSPSFGHLVSELNNANLGDATEAFRKQGGTIPDEQRAGFRRVGFWLLGVPIAFGTTVVGLVYVKNAYWTSPDGAVHLSNG